MDREGEDGRVVGEDRSGAVPLVDVAVDDDDPPGLPFRLEDPGGDGRVVEQAESRPVVPVGVVRPAGQVDRDSILEGEPTRLDRGPDRPPRSLDQVGRPGKADDPDLVAREAPADRLADIVRVMGGPELVLGRGGRDQDVLGLDQSRLLEPPAEPGVLDHREPVPVGQRDREAVAGEGFQGRPHRARLSVSSARRRNRTGAARARGFAGPDGRGWPSRGRGASRGRRRRDRPRPR